MKFDLVYDSACSKLENKESLMENELLVLAINGLNYQVNNGGFDGWFSNGYGKDTPILLEFMIRCKDNEVIAEVLELFKDVVSSYMELARWGFDEEDQKRLYKMDNSMQPHIESLKAKIEDSTHKYWDISEEFFSNARIMYEWKY